MKGGAEIKGCVARCVARQDGGYWIVTTKNQHAIATEEIREGAWVVIRDGKATRANT